MVEECCQKDCHARARPYEEINGNYRCIQIRKQYFTCEGVNVISLAILLFPTNRGDAACPSYTRDAPAPRAPTASPGRCTSALPVALAGPPRRTRRQTRTRQGPPCGPRHPCSVPAVSQIRSQGHAKYLQPPRRKSSISGCCQEFHHTHCFPTKVVAACSHAQVSSPASAPCVPVYPCRTRM